MAVKKWRVVKRGGEWVATSPPIHTPGCPSECAIAKVFCTWESAMAYVLNWIEGERADNRRKNIKLMNDMMRWAARNS